MRSLACAVSFCLFVLSPSFLHAQSAVEPPSDAAGASAPSVHAAAPAPWTYAEFTRAAEASGRNMKMSEKTFQSVQERKNRALERIQKYLEGKFGTADEEVMAAFAKVPREYFHYNYEAKYSEASVAYEDTAKPWGIGYGSVLSDYLGQAYMTQLSEPDADDVVLEIGTGSGFQSSLLSRIVKEVYTIEIIKPVGEGVTTAIDALEYGNVHVRVGDGFFGWPEVEGGFDIIMVTCAASYVPPALLEQLKPGGRLLIPVGPPIRGRQVLYVYTKDEEGKIHSRRDTGVYFIPMQGAIEKSKPAPKVQ